MRVEEKMIVNIEQIEDNVKHTGFPCPRCNVITIRQPWASLIALQIKPYEFRSQNFKELGPVIIHSGVNWYSPSEAEPGEVGLRDVLRDHFQKYGKADDILKALFPFGSPVAEAVVTECTQWTDDEEIKYKFALKLDQVRMMTRPKPVLKGMEKVPWKTRDSDRTKELASALARSRVLEGEEKNAVYREFGLIALRSKLTTFLEGRKQDEFVLTPFL
jgi:hypothetical protein